MEGVGCWEVLARVSRCSILSDLSLSGSKSDHGPVEFEKLPDTVDLRLAWMLRDARDDSSPSSKRPPTAVTFLNPVN